jgi:hypothetical protein
VPVKLKLSWDTPPLVNTDCWVGISNWSTGSWTMQPLNVLSELTLTSPGHYLNASQQCYVAVIVLGDAPCTLATIGFGVPAPPATSDGYTLIAPLNDKGTYLIDMDGSVAHSWASPYFPGAAVELLPNGHLLRADNVGNANFMGGGEGGKLTESDWDGNEVWSYELSTETQCLHHDFAVLPNGNILMILWSLVADADVVQAGRDPATLIPRKFWIDSVIEVEPIAPSGGNIVWQWDLADHLVQDYDAGVDNFGDVGAQPELVDINFPRQNAGDWTHFNGVYYNAQLDQVMVSVRTFSEFWVIDHSTTTAEAASHSGGRYGRGGDLLYRWGNPQAYRQGGTADQQLFLSHDAHWIPEGLDGAGDILVFNNQAGSLQGLLYSTVVQLTPPLNADGSYALSGGKYGPDNLTWQFMASPPESFYSGFVSSAQRLPGGNTLVCEGQYGYIFEVDPSGNIGWSYQNPFTEVGPNARGVFRATRYRYDYPGVAALSQ